uniref:Uncharacterized protein n=1 Tax=Candidozyma auris TaxID=498019 RepID=A0A0L0P1G2_CANAR
MKGGDDYAALQNDNREKTEYFDTHEAYLVRKLLKPADLSQGYRARKRHSNVPTAAVTIPGHSSSFRLLKSPTLHLLLQPES